MTRIKKELKLKSHGTKERICNSCKEIFTTEIDRMGFSIETRCKDCKSKARSNKISRLKPSNIYL